MNTLEFIEMLCYKDAEIIMRIPFNKPTLSLRASKKLTTYISNAQDEFLENVTVAVFFEKTLTY